MQAASPSSAGPGPASTQSLQNTGLGQDFILFEDASLKGLQQQLSASTSTSQAVNPPAMVGDASTTMISRPTFEPTSSFTEYRGSQQGLQVESPFSSPASRLEDDFGLENKSTTAEAGSGTLIHGTPRSKRQRGHGYSSSWTGGNLEQHRHQTRQPGISGGTLATAMGPTQSFEGYPNVNADWSGSDTSPQNPPSGNFGPPIHSLSLGDGGETLTTLFPGSSTGPETSMPAVSDLGSLQSTLASALPPSTSAQQHQQQERAREQIRAELMGVDSRALKGPLRDIQQGTSQDTNQLLLNQLNPFPFSSNNFFPTNQSNSFERPKGLIRQRSGSLDESFLTNGQNSFSTDLNGSNSMSWSGLSTNDLNAFDLQGLDVTRPAPKQFSAPPLQQQQYSPDFVRKQAQRQTNVAGHSQSTSDRPTMPEPRFSARTQQAVDRAKAQKPTRKRLTRDGSGLTISPQEAFLDYNNIEPLIQASRPDPQSLPAVAQNLFAPLPQGLSDSSSESTVHTPKAFNVNSTPFGGPTSWSTQEGTPSLVEGSSSSSNNSRAASAIASPPQRLPLNREDTVRPPKSQSTSSSQQMSSTSDMFSPAYSTTSSTDDEDEKPYESNKPTSAGWQFPFPAQSSHAGGSHHGNVSGPRFSAVSSSSSESEEDDQRGRNANHSLGHTSARRTMGGYGYMGSSQESGLSAATPYYSQPFQQNIGLAPSQQQQMHHQIQAQPSQGFHNLSLSTTGVYGTDQSSRSGGGHQSDSQSQDDGPSLSPSIRSSAQAIVPSESRHSHHAHVQVSHDPKTTSRQRSRSRNRAQAAAAAPAHRRSSDAENTSVSESSEWETGEESETEGSDFYAPPHGGGGGAGGGGGGGGGGGNSRRKPASSRKRRRDGASSRQAGTGTGHGGGGTNASSHSQLTICDYVSPLSGESCQTEFHRPYDLARHRETIHAREEALLLRQGRLKKEQCVVLYKEVDPQKSLATVEWKCEGKNGCGSLFSRKDALLRHKRIRGH